MLDVARVSLLLTALPGFVQACVPKLLSLTALSGLFGP
jgi:hypothetical protein